MAKIEVAIFTVYVFRMEGDKRKLHIHYVAGLNSADAAERIANTYDWKNHRSEHTYITSDDCNERHTEPCVKWYTTSYKNEDHITDKQFEGWINQMTKLTHADGERIPPSVIKI